MNLRPFAVALSLLTRYPIPAAFWQGDSSPETQRQSTLYYPVVGILVALPLALVAQLSTQYFSALFSAAIITAAWLWITGALHLDGLMDCADGYFAAHKPKQDVLNIMRDPHCGPMAVLTAVGVLLLKFACLYELLSRAHSPLLFIAVCSLPRALALLYMQITPYASAGIASQLDSAHYRRQAWLFFVLSLALGAALLSFAWAVSALALLLMLLFLWRRYWLTTIGGYSGDCLGGLIELGELGLLCTGVVALHRP